MENNKEVEREGSVIFLPRKGKRSNLLIGILIKNRLGIKGLRVRFEMKQLLGMKWRNCKLKMCAILYAVVK